VARAGADRLPPQARDRELAPFGAFFIGGLAEAFGAPVAFAAGGGLGLACVLALGLRWMRRGAA
jgi:hypothetical protein